MELDFSVSTIPGGFDGGDWERFQPRKKVRVLLHEPERCVQCERYFESLYPVRNCSDHEGLKSI